EGGAHTRVPPVALTALSRAGVTTAVGLLGTDTTTRTLHDLLACARGLEHFGLTALCYTGGYDVPPPTLTGSVRGDLVHVDRMVAVGELALSDHRSSQPTFDELVRIAADAHVAGMMTGKAGLVHLHLGDGPRGLSMVRRAVRETELPARTFHPTHCNRNPALWQEALDAAASGLWVDVSAFPYAEGDGTVAAWDAVAGYLRAGLDPEHLTVSSDAGGCLPEFDADGRLLHMGVGDAGGLLDTVRRAIAAGVAPELALAAVTRNPARLFRFAGKGELVAGADADLVAVDAGWSVRRVWARGRPLVVDGAPVERGWFEAR
ncbi:MAG: amidohydrolase family protein, partial [Myxococcota bacterium]